MREQVRAAVERSGEDVSLTVTAFTAAGEFTSEGMDARPSLLIRTFPPANGPTGPLRLALANYERPMASIKHVGEIAKTTALHDARRVGFDDAAFVDRQGRLSEGTIWNLVFWDGESVVWPCADSLDGTMQGMVRRQLDRMGVPQRHAEVRRTDLAGLGGAAVMNSWTPAVEVTGFDTVEMNRSPRFLALLRDALAAEPAEAP